MTNVKVIYQYLDIYKKTFSFNLFTWMAIRFSKPTFSHMFEYSLLYDASYFRWYAIIPINYISTSYVIISLITAFIRVQLNSRILAKLKRNASFFEH